jgi:predicted flap endonuclease-1-like 5' DNA nuclease
MNQITLTDIHFSIKEIKKSGLGIKLLKFNKVKVDVRRKSEKPANIELLKKMKLTPLPIGGQKMPKKAKSIKVAKVEKEEKVIKETEEIKEPTITKPISKEEVKSEPKESKITKLEDLEGMVPKYLKKLADLGIDTPMKLMDEDFKELAKLITSTQKLIKSWQAQITGEE